MLPLLEALLLKLTNPRRDAEITLQHLLTAFEEYDRERLEVAQLVEWRVLFGWCSVGASNGRKVRRSRFYAPEFLARRRVTRHAPVEAFKKFRSASDPGGLFYNEYLCQLLGG